MRNSNNKVHNIFKKKIQARKAFKYFVINFLCNINYVCIQE